MDPATEFKGGQPVAADSLYGIIPPSLIGGMRPVFMDFGADGALYVGYYAGSLLRVQQRQHGRLALRLHRRRGHPGSRSEGDRAADRQRRRSSTSASPAASPTSGTSATAARR